MLHAIYVVSVMLIAPTLCVIIAYAKESKTAKPQLIPLLCRWFVFWSIGIRSATAGLMQMLNPAYTERLLNVGTENMLIIQELGFANLAIGVIAIVSLFVPAFRKPAAAAGGIFLMGAAILHLLRLSVIEFGEVMSLAGDLLIVAIAVLCLTYREKVRQA